MTQPHRTINSVEFYKLYRFYVNMKKIEIERQDIKPRETYVERLENYIKELIELNPDYAKEYHII